MKNYKTNPKAAWSYVTALISLGLQWLLFHYLNIDLGTDVWAFIGTELLLPIVAALFAMAGSFYTRNVLGKLDNNLTEKL